MIQHILVPEHRKLSEEEAGNILVKFNISRRQLPRIKINDPAILELEPKKGDIIEIKRNSIISGKSLFYRVVS